MPQRTVQSVANNFSAFVRNLSLEGPVERLFSDLDDGDGDVDGLGLVGSGYLMGVTVTY